MLNYTFIKVYTKLYITMSNQSTTETTEVASNLPLWKDGRNGSAVQFVRSFSRLEKEEPRTYKLLTLVEGFECEDSNFVYRVGKSKYGLWLSRKRKEGMENNNNNSSNNGDNNGDSDTGDMKPETRPTAFLNNNNNNNNNNNDQQQQDQQQQQQAAVVYPISIKLEQDPKGRVKCSIHCYGYDGDIVKDEVIRLFVKTQDELKGKGINVLEGND